MRLRINIYITGMSSSYAASMESYLVILGSIMPKLFNYTIIHRRNHHHGREPSPGPRFLTATWLRRAR